MRFLHCFPHNKYTNETHGKYTRSLLRHASHTNRSIPLLGGRGRGKIRFSLKLWFAIDARGISNSHLAMHRSLARIGGVNASRGVTSLQPFARPRLARKMWSTENEGPGEYKEKEKKRKRETKRGTKKRKKYTFAYRAAYSHSIKKFP